MSTVFRADVLAFLFCLIETDFIRRRQTRKYYATLSQYYHFGRRTLTYTRTSPCQSSRSQRVLRSQTDNATPSGLPASPVWLTAYRDIVLASGTRATYTEYRRESEEARGVCQGDCDFLCVSRAKHVS